MERAPMKDAESSMWICFHGEEALPYSLEAFIVTIIAGWLVGPRQKISLPSLRRSEAGLKRAYDRAVRKMKSTRTFNVHFAISKLYQRAQRHRICWSGRGSVPSFFSYHIYLHSYFSNAILECSTFIHALAYSLIATGATDKYKRYCMRLNVVLNSENAIKLPINYQHIH